MTAAILLTRDEPAAALLGEDLRAVGITVLGMSDCTNLLQDVIRAAPDLVICSETSPDRAFFECTTSIGVSAPCPMLVFTSDQDAGKIADATRAHIHAYVVNGYSRGRIRSVVHLAQARFRHDHLLRQELLDVQQRFDERKLVDRAKGILMGARQLREEEAFRALRSAAMVAKQRIGQVSQQVIDTAHYAEAMNRAGQLRMLSQRVVKLYALTCASVGGVETGALFTEAVAQADTNLAVLGRTLSNPTFGDLLDAVAEPWALLRTVLQAPARLDRLREVDGLAEDVLGSAEQLTANLEVAAFATALRAVNVAGRQRMLSQRVAKEVMMVRLLPPGTATAAQASLARSTTELMAGLSYLAALPLTNADISRELAAATAVWHAFDAAATRPDSPAGRVDLATLSEALLSHFDRLTAMVERGVQALVC